MANIRKQFNFRNGVQVDDDNLIVTSTGLVGIGTTIPTEILDVRGNAKVVGLATVDQLFTPSLTATSANITNLTLSDSIIGSGVSISSGIITASGSGIVTYYGDGVYLRNIPTSQWTDVNSGLGFTSIYAKGFVGVGTVDPRFVFQVSGNTSTTVVGFTSGVGISSEGNILATGIVTAYKYIGIASGLTQLNASELTYGTVSLDRFPSSIPDYKLDPNLNLGIVTTTSLQTGVVTTTSLTVTNTIAGVANTALGLSGTPDIIVGVLTATAVSASSFIGGITGDVTGNLTGTATTATSLTSTADVDIQDLTVGVATVTTTLVIDGNVGIGTSVSNRDILIQRTGTNADIQLVSDNESVISLGRSDNLLGYNGMIKYGNVSGLFPYSDSYALDFINYGNGNINYYLEAAGSVGVNTGNFHWHRSSSRLMTLTNEGNLGVGITNPTARLEVAGITSTADLFVTNDLTLQSNLVVNNDITATSAGSSVSVANLYVTGGRTSLLDGEGNQLIVTENIDNFTISSGISTLNDLDVYGKLHIEADFGGGGGVLVASAATDERPLAPFQVGLGTDSGVVVINNDGQIGIGTTLVPDSVSLDCSSGTGTFDRIGIGTRTVTVGAAIQAHGPIVILESTSEEFPGNPGIEAVGVGTFTGGVSTGVGDGVIKMSVTGSQLTITVLGVGSTTLTLS